MEGIISIRNNSFQVLYVADVINLPGLFLRHTIQPSYEAPPRI